MFALCCPAFGAGRFIKFSDSLAWKNVLGTVNRRKGADIFVEAIELLPPPIRKRAQFSIVGDKTEGDFYQKIEDRIKHLDEVEISNSAPFDEFIEMYSNFDVIVSASRVDPMPIVLSYGFMFKKVCLCSDSIGTALLINDGHDGVLFKNESAADLSKKMMVIIENWEQYQSIGIAGRSIYEKHFSTSMFDMSIARIFGNLRS